MIPRNFGEAVEDFKTLLNRGDCTQTQAEQFVRDGINRTTRRLGPFLPSYDVEATLTIDANGRADIPSDFLSMIDFEDDIGSEFQAITLDRIKHERLVPGRDVSLTQGTSHASQPVRFWVRRLKQFDFFPNFTEGQTLNILYRADPAAICTDEDYIPILLHAPEAVKYASLVYARSFFKDREGQQEAAALFEGIVGEIENQHAEMVAAEINTTMHSAREDEEY